MNSLFSDLLPVLSAGSMREADHRTIEELGIPGFTLMEVAGRAVADEAMFLLDDFGGNAVPPRVVCLCGKGNNGGDGFVTARILHQAGFDVEVVLLSSPEVLTGDAKAHFEILRRVASREKSLRVDTWSEETSIRDVSGVTLFVDAILGTGLSSDVREPLASFITWINAQSVPVLAVDLPSGLCADSGSVLGVSINADVTVTLGALKTGLFIGDGPDYSGAVVMADIGIPDFIIEEVAGDDFRVRLCQFEFVEALLPTRTRADHKYASGPTIVLGGSDRYSGAPVLAATAAARIGSGYVSVVAPASIAPLLAEKLTEIPVTPLSDGSATVQVENMIAELGKRWDKAKAFLVGPGLGRETHTKELILEVLDKSSGPVIVDADGLFALSDEKNFVSSRSNGNWIFTPHAGEFARLCGVDEIPTIDDLVTFSREWDVVLLMKGMPSITTSPLGEVVINNTGNPAAATAGSGDVLSGIIAGLVSQGIAPFEAAVSGIHIAGAIADRYAADFGVNSMMAGDVLELLPAYLSDPS